MSCSLEVLMTIAEDFAYGSIPISVSIDLYFLFKNIRDIIS